MKVLFIISFSTIFLSCQHGKKHHHNWEMMDKDGNESISQAEFDQGHQAKFKELDKNSDGQLSKDELKSYRHKKCDKKKECKSKKKCTDDKQCKMKSKDKTETQSTGNTEEK